MSFARGKPPLLGQNILDWTNAVDKQLAEGTLFPWEKVIGFEAR